MPASAFILETCYAEPGGWQHTNTQWTWAAAKLARAWLAFYAQADAPHDRRHNVNRALLWRVYAFTLLRLASLGADWSDDQEDELERAVGEWLTACTDERQSWLFQSQLAPWWGPGFAASSRGGLADREAKREWAVNAVHDQLLVVAALEHQRYQVFAREQLEILALTWYLPRYDVVVARRIISKLGHWAGLLGFTRLFAGTVIGFSVFIFQSDSWLVLRMLSTGWRFDVTLALSAGLLGYLWVGIQQRIKVWSASFKRSLMLYGINQLLAIALAYWLTNLLWPFIIRNPEATPSLGTPVLLAQLAIFIGIFTQLLFDDRPTTLPLDNP